MRFLKITAGKVLLLLPLFWIGSGQAAFAQKILKDTTVNVVRSFQPTIADAYKINDMPAVRDSIPPAPNLQYTIHSKKIYTPFTVEPLKPARMVGEPLSKLYNSLVKVGAGNYNTPYAEIFLNNGRSKEMTYGAHLKHLSSKADMDGYGFGGFSDNAAELYGKKFFRKQTLSANLDYSRNVVHYYGYDTALVKIKDNDLIRQRYSAFGGNVSLQSHYTDSTHLNYLVTLGGYTFSDFYSAVENNASAKAEVRSYYEKQLIRAPLTVDYYNNRSSFDTSGTTLVTLSPSFTSSGTNWNAHIGVGVTMEENKNDNSRFFFYPNLDFNYNVFDNILVPYAGVTGGLRRNSLRSLTGENPFMMLNPALKNTNEKWQAYGGIKGSISKAVSYNARTSYSKTDDLPFFVNSDLDGWRKGFSAEYYNVSIWNVHGELQYQYTEKIKFLAKGDYNKYMMPSDTLRPWHRPALQFTFSANYNLKNKIVVNADVIVVGKRYAYVAEQFPNTSVTTIKELGSIVDANLGLEYRYSKKLSAFVRLNNLGFSRYYLWNNYPSYKFNFLVGVTAAF